MAKLCDRIKKARNELHLSQKYVADYLGISRSAVANIEADKRKVSADELKKLSDLFLIPVDELLKGRNTQMPTQVFARSFEALDENDQQEILDLMEFKLAIKGRN